MITPDYQGLKQILKERGISRRRLAIEVGIPENSLAASFLRSSKLQVAQFAAICEFLQINPFSYIQMTEGGQPTADALELSAFYGYPFALGRYGSEKKDFWEENDRRRYKAILKGLDQLNPLGLDEVAHFLEILENSPLYILPDDDKANRTANRSTMSSMEKIRKQFDEFIPNIEEDPHG